ncbi:MAG: right-handed parallel beta-helix repeat-containing protein [Anaerolineaceae bacterium]|nr:right-handed parallel beta-helix repeat-containing protein [Anaerolineaceae bacterium]MBN2676430.1 right-handed parallel beta-helix repeat-containing protein [Anaerolineaceae bacterium]
MHKTGYILVLPVILFGLVGSTKHLFINFSPMEKDYFVSPVGSGTACSQSIPCLYQTAIDASGSGDNLYFAEGQYTADSGSEVIYLDKSIHLYGGWDGEASGPIIKDPRAYPSIINGEDERRVFTINSAGSPIIDGFNITNGNASTAPCPHESRCGGGILINDSNPEIRNNNIYSNKGSTLGDGRGGAIAIEFSIGNAIIEKNNIYQNESDTSGIQCGGGGAIFTWSSDSIIQDNIISYNNYAAKDLYCIGTAVYISSSNDSLLSNRIVYNYGGPSVVVTSNSSSIVDGNVIINPEADKGLSSNFTLDSSQLTITNNFFSDHKERNVDFYDSQSRPLDILMSHNTLNNSPIGINISDGIFGQINSNIISNSAIGIVKNNPNGDVTIVNNLFWGNIDNGDLGNPYFTNLNPRYIDSSIGDYHLDYNSQAIDLVECRTDIPKDIDGDTRVYLVGVSNCDVGADETFWKLYFLPVALK